MLSVRDCPLECVFWNATYWACEFLPVLTISQREGWGNETKKPRIVNQTGF
jgi:hypothetical protein